MINHWEGSSVIRGASHADCLRLVLNVRSTWFAAASKCIESIHKDLINGSSAVYCIAEIRLAISKYARIVSGDEDESQKIISELEQLALLCLAPLAAPVDTAATPTDNQNAFATGLEALPPLLAALYNLDAEESAVRILDEAFATHWDISQVVPMVSILCELYPYLSSHHLSALKV